MLQVVIHRGDGVLDGQSLGISMKSSTTKDQEQKDDGTELNTQMGPGALMSQTQFILIACLYSFSLTQNIC